MINLILTAFDKKNKIKEKNSLYLGQWCNFDNSLNHNSIEDYHWNDRKKYLKDYKYLKKIYKQTLQKLSNYLNTLHNKNHSMRYWSIILNPWLVSYISNSFDKWNSIKKISYKKYKVNFYNIKIKDDFLIDDYKIFNNDLVQQYLCQRIITFRFKKKFLIQENIYIKKNRHKKKASNNKNNFRYYIYLIFDEFLKIFSKKKKFIFIDTYHNFFSTIIINFFSFQLPRFFFRDFKLEYKKSKVNFRKKFSNSSKDHFLNFILNSIHDFLPLEFIENFNEINKKINSIDIKAKKIVVGRSLWEDTIKKFWVAKQIENKVKLFTAEHGGGLPDKSSHFDFNIDYSDKFLSWAKIKNKKYKQLPADKFLFKTNKNNIDKKSRKLILVEPIFEKHIGTLSSRSVSSLFLNHINMINIFYERLPKQIKINTFVKLSPIREIKSEKFYKFVNYIKAKNKLSDVLNSAKIIVCSYPQTTLSESIMSNKPVIVFYPEEIYSRYFGKNKNLINKMLKCKMLFFDPEEAAKHIGKIFKDPYSWWSSEEVQKTRNLYKRDCLGDTGSNYKNIIKWKRFLR